MLRICIAHFTFESKYCITKSYRFGCIRGFLDGILGGFYAVFPPSPFSKLNNIAKVPVDLPLTSRLRNKRALRKSGSRVPFHIPRKGQKDTLIKFSSRATIATDVFSGGRTRDGKGW